jgi:hypothetical protein
MPKRTVIPDRISLSTALEHLRPFMSRSKFYGAPASPGPRWTMIDELDLCAGPPMTLDRPRFFRWLRHLQGSPARLTHTNARKLGRYSLSDTAAEISGSFGERMAALCRAHEAGHISEATFQRAVRDLVAQ